MYQHEYPQQERRHHSDVFPGMMFYFIASLDYSEQVFIGAYTVVGKSPLMDGTCMLLLLTPVTTLVWHKPQLGWIRRICDPVWEERKTNGWGTMFRGHLHQV